MSRQTLQYHPIIAYKFIPGLKARIPHVEGGGYLIRVNDLGFRCDHNFVIEKQPGIRRILLFGDSFTAGDGVSNGNRFGDLLETEIPNLEVYNFGLPGTGTDQHYLTYKEYAQNIQHDLLIITIFVENIHRVAAHYRIFLSENGEHVCYEKPYYELIDGRLNLKNVPPDKEPISMQDISQIKGNSIDFGSPLKRIGTIFEKWGIKNFERFVNNVVNKWGLKNILLKLIRVQPLPEYNDPANPDWLTMKAILEEWIDHHPKPVLLVLIPHSYYVEGIASPRYYQTRFRELGKLVDCKVYDLLPDLQRFPMKMRRDLRYRDGHFNNKGHLVVAKQLKPILTNLLDTK
jgi:hypothetical protein